MPYHIRNASGETYFTTRAWLKLLQVAISYGWEPTRLWFDLQTEHAEGASPYSAEGSQTRSYLSASSTVVSAEEARRLARALVRALPDLPDHDAKAHLRQQRGGGIDYQEEENLSALESFSGTNKARLKGFISLCYSGGFTLS